MTAENAERELTGGVSPSDAPASNDGFSGSLQGMPSVGAPPSKQPEGPQPMPGLEVLGRGIYLKPRQPYELKHCFVGERATVPLELKPGEGVSTVFCVDAEQSYLVPNEFEINHSPPMPANQTLNQTVIEQSWESLESYFEVDANVAAGVSAFSVKANYSQIDQLRSSEEAYFALRTSFIPSWTVDFTGQPDVEALRQSLSKLKEYIQRIVFIDKWSQEDVWIYDTLLSKSNEDLVVRFVSSL